LNWEPPDFFFGAPPGPELGDPEPSGVAGSDGREASGSEGGLANRTADPTEEIEREPELERFEIEASGESEPEVDMPPDSAAERAAREARLEPDSDPSDPPAEEDKAAESADKEPALNPG